MERRDTINYLRIDLPSVISNREILLRALILITTMLVFLTPTWAGELQVEQNVSPETGTVNDIFELEISVSGTERGNVSQPSFEENSNFDLIQHSTAVNQLLVNGKASFRYSYTFQLSPKPDLKPGRYDLPRVSVEGSGKQTSLKPLTITITDEPQTETSPSGTSRDTQNKEVQFLQNVENTAPYVGEQLLYQAQIVTSKRLFNASISETNFAGFWHESFEKNRETTHAFGNDNFTVYLVKEALFPTEPGQVTIPARILNTQIESEKKREHHFDRYGGVWGGLFSFDMDPSFNLVKKRIASEPITLSIKPLPEPPVRGLSSIPVGKVKLAFSVDKTALKQGENLTLVIELYGDANLRSYELPPLSESDKRNFKSYVDSPALDLFYEKDRVFFKKKFSMALVPQRSGTLSLPRFSIVTFDPSQKEYKILETPQRVVEVEAAPGTKESLNPGAVLPETPVVGEEKKEEKKQEIQILGEDLLPQHLSGSIGEKKCTPHPAIFWSVLVLMPALSLLLWRWGTEKHLRDSSPHLLAQKNAKRDVTTFLDEVLKKRVTGELSLLSEEVPSLFLRYLSDRFQVQGSALTPSEAATFVYEKTKDDSLKKETKELLSSFDRVRFGGASHTVETVEQTIHAIKNLISRIDEKSS